MVELLQICCLMHHVWPLLHNYLGAGKLLDGIMDQWRLGYLGSNQNRVLLGLGFWSSIVVWNLDSASQNLGFPEISWFLGCCFKIWKMTIYSQTLGFVMWNLDSASHLGLDFPNRIVHGFISKWCFLWFYTSRLPCCQKTRLWCGF